MALTQEQFQKARQAGFSTDQIIDFEKKRNTQLDNAPVDNQNSLTRTLSTSAKQKPSGDPVIDALIFAQKEIVGPLAQGANTAAFGIPRAITKAVAGDEFAKQAFPQQSTGLGKTLRFGSEATGLIGGGTGQIATRIAQRMIPKTGAKLGQKILGNAVAGGVSSATVSPDNFTDLKARGLNTVVGAAGGAALPIAGALASKIPLGAKTVAQNMYRQIASLPKSAIKFGKDPMSVFSKEKIIGNSYDDFAKNAKNLLEERNNQLKESISGSNKTVDAESIVDKHLSDALLKSKGSLKDRSVGIKELDEAKQRMIAKYGDLKNLTVQKAVEMKRQLADDFPFVKEDPNNINTKAAHKIYHDLNDLVETAHPEIRDLNQRVSSLIDISNAASNKAFTHAGKVGLGLVDSILGVGGGIASGNPLTGVALVAAKRALGSVAVQSRVAKALTQLSEADLSKALSNNPWLASVLNKQQKTIATPVDAELLGGKPAPFKTMKLPAPSFNEPIMTKAQSIRPEMKSKYNDVHSKAQSIKEPIILNAKPTQAEIDFVNSFDKSKSTPETRRELNRILNKYNINVSKAKPTVIKSNKDVAVKKSSFNPKPEIIRSYKNDPQTDFGRQIKQQVLAKEEVPLHPAEMGRSALKSVYKEPIKYSKNIPLTDRKDFNDMLEYESWQQKGGPNISGGGQGGSERVVVYSKSGHSKAIQDIGGPKRAFQIFTRASNGERLTPKERAFLKNAIEDYKRNVKPKMIGSEDIKTVDNNKNEYLD